MTEHPEIGPELQQLAKTILAMLDPLIQAGAALASTAESGTPGECTQMCPVCAVAALASGEHHPLASAIAEHGAALLALIRAVASPDDPTPPSGGAPPEDDVQQSPTPSGYQPIPVTIHE